MPDSAVPVAIGLGSNLGDRLAHLRQAVEFLRGLHEGAEEGFRTSRIYETLPVDCPPGSPSFLNAAVRLQSAVGPWDWLQRLQGFEVRSGRPAEHGYHRPRTLDLDLLLHGDTQLADPRLTLPHPRIRERPFVLLPLADVWPEGRLCGEPRTFAELRESIFPSMDIGVAIFAESL